MNGAPSPEYFLTNLSPSKNEYSSLNHKKWRLLKEDEQYNISKIEDSGLTLGKMFEICVGIATLKDNLYFIDNTTLNGDCYEKSVNGLTFRIEKNIVKPIYKISDFQN